MNIEKESGIINYKYKYKNVVYHCFGIFLSIVVIWTLSSVSNLEVFIYIPLTLPNLSIRISCISEVQKTVYIYYSRLFTLQ